MYRARLYFKYEEQQQYRVLQPKQKYILSFNSLFLYIGLWVLLAGMLREILRDISRLCSHLSSSYITALSLAESFIVMKYFHGDATKVLLCYKDIIGRPYATNCVILA